MARDVEASVAFYRRLGVEFPELPPEWAAWRPHHQNGQTAAEGASLDIDSAAFARQWDEGWPGTGMGVLGFRLPTREAVDELYAALVADGVPSQQAPYDAFWGSRFAVVEDPDGNAVALMSPRDEAFRGATPEPPA